MWHCSIRSRTLKAQAAAIRFQHPFTLLFSITYMDMQPQVTVAEVASPIACASTRTCTRDKEIGWVERTIWPLPDESTALNISGVNA
jgi:hypothetical protein